MWLITHAKSLKSLMGFLYFSLMKFEIREGIKTDLPAVLKLIQELAEYEKAIDQVTI